ncbi:MAG: manganese catalase family protein, partial [Proteobacteria bacterium]
YFTQGLAEIDPNRKDMLMDIATEELSHLEVIGNIVVMLNSGVKASMAEGLEDGILMSEMNQGGSSATSALLYGGGAPLTNSAGVPWTSAYVDSITDPTCDLRSNIAAESRAKIVYERLISLTDDPGIKEALGFLMTREIAHQKSFEKALYSIKENFPSGKLPGNPEYTDKYYNLSKGDGDSRGPWNNGNEWEFVTELGKMSPVDKGDGTATVKLSKEEMKLTQQVAARTASDPKINPLTGADIGAKKDGSAGTTKNTTTLQ